MNILDLKRKAQSFHYRESQEGEGRTDWDALGVGLGFNSVDDYNKWYQGQQAMGPGTRGYEGGRLGNVAINGDQYQNYQGGKLVSDQIYDQNHADMSFGGALTRYTKAVAPIIAKGIATYYGASAMGSLLSGASAAGAGAAGAGAAGSDSALAASSAGDSAITAGTDMAGAAELGSNASNFYDYGELGNVPGMSTATQNPSWMEKLSGYLPQVTSAAKTVGTGLDYTQKGLGLYSLYNKYNNANNNAAIANQIQGNSSQIANNDAAIQDQIRGINEQIGKIPTLESLYGTDSAYAKNLMKQLAAKDAASGRNSQYAPRLEEFNGKLAAVAGDYANKYAQQVGALNNSIASLYRERTGASTALTNNAKAIADLNNASNISKTQTLSSLYDQYKSSGLSNALQNYFKNNGSISGPESSVSTWDDQGY